LQILRKIHAGSVFSLIVAAILSAPVPAQPTELQTRLLATNCVQCHARPETGAPIMGVPDDWQEAAARGEDAILLNVVYGIRGMPPLGYCAACTEEDFRVLIRLMSDISAVAGDAP
jgi:cytochrome c5